MCSTADHTELVIAVPAIVPAHAWHSSPSFVDYREWQLWHQSQTTGPIWRRFTGSWGGEGGGHLSARERAVSHLATAPPAVFAGWPPTRWSRSPTAAPTRGRRPATSPPPPWSAIRGTSSAAPRRDDHAARCTGVRWCLCCTTTTDPCNHPCRRSRRPWTSAAAAPGTWWWAARLPLRWVEGSEPLLLLLRASELAPRPTPPLPDCTPLPLTTPSPPRPPMIVQVTHESKHFMHLFVGGTTAVLLWKL